MKYIKLDRLIELCFKTTLGYLVFWLAFASVPFASALIQNSTTIKKIFSQENYLVIAETSIKIDVADSKSERTKGLSGLENIETGYGMYFIFENSDYHGIWMKDMKFAIDIIWISEGQEVVHIEENVSPNSFPKVFKPRAPAKFVLEVNEGFVRRNGIKPGDIVTQF